jgi:hypothetical protein
MIDDHSTVVDTVYSIQVYHRYVYVQWYVYVQYSVLIPLYWAVYCTTVYCAYYHCILYCSYLATAVWGSLFSGY